MCSHGLPTGTLDATAMLLEEGYCLGSQSPFRKSKHLQMGYIGPLCGDSVGAEGSSESVAAAARNLTLLILGIRGAYPEDLNHHTIREACGARA